eukprot:572070_1
MLIDIAEIADIWSIVELFIAAKPWHLQSINIATFDEDWNNTGTKRVGHCKLNTLCLLNKRWHAFIKSNVKYLNLSLMYPDSGVANALTVPIQEALDSFQFTGLQYINLRETHLNAMPKALKLCPNVHYLDLSENEIGDTLDNSYFEMWQDTMVHLHLSGIRLKLLPSNIKLLTRLKTLALNNNHLQDIPIELVQPLCNLELFRYDFNPLSHFPISLPSLRIFFKRQIWLTLQLSYNSDLDTILKYFHSSVIPKHDMIENPEKYRLDTPVHARPQGRHLRFRHQSSDDDCYYDEESDEFTDESAEVDEETARKQKEEEAKKAEQRRLRTIEEQKQIECYFANDDEELVKIMTDIVVRYFWNKNTNWDRYGSFEEGEGGGWHTPQYNRYRIECVKLNGHYNRRLDDFPTINHRFRGNSNGLKLQRVAGPIQETLIKTMESINRRGQQIAITF